MSYVHPFSKRCDKSEVDLFSVPPTQQSLERGRWIDYPPISSVQNPDSAITLGVVVPLMISPCKTKKKNGGHGRKKTFK